MAVKHKNGYERRVKPRSFSLRLDTIEELEQYDEINWSRVVQKLLDNYLSQLDQMESTIKINTTEAHQ